MSTKTPASKSTKRPTKRATAAKPPASKPSTNPFVSDHAKHLDRGPKYGSSGSRRGK